MGSKRTVGNTQICRTTSHVSYAPGLHLESLPAREHKVASCVAPCKARQAENRHHTPK